MVSADKPVNLTLSRFLHAGFYNIPVAILHAHASESQFEQAAATMTNLHPAFWSSYVHYDWQV